jgi:hypothetical protein
MLYIVYNIIAHRTLVGADAVSCGMDVLLLGR